MTDDDADLIETQLTLGLGGTVSVEVGGAGNPFSDWVKPSCTYSIKWKGIPSEEQLRTSVQFTATQILAPVMEDIIVMAQSKLEEHRRNR